MALAQSTGRQTASSKFNQVPSRFSTPSYFRKGELFINSANLDDEETESQSDNTEHLQRVSRTDDEEIDELVSSDESNRNKSSQ